MMRTEEFMQVLRDAPEPNVQTPEFIDAWDALDAEDELGDPAAPQTHFTFRSRPVVKEAVRLPLEVTPYSFLNAPLWMRQALLAGAVQHIHGDDWLVETLEGTMRAKSGSFIVRGLVGELYACEATIFAQSYEPVARRSAFEQEAAMRV